MTFKERLLLFLFFTVVTFVILGLGVLVFLSASLLFGLVYFSALIALFIVSTSS